MSKKAIIILVAAIVSVGVLAAVIFGVLTHEEPTFLDVCWKGNTAKFTETKQDESCDRVEELVWPKSHLPITVTVEPYAGKLVDFALGQVEEAVELINYQLGKDHLEFMGSNPNGESVALVRVVYGTPYESGTDDSADRSPGLCTVSRSNDGTYRAQVDIRDLGDIALTFRILIHELGHCGLGLAHDDYRDSIMYPVIRMSDVEKGRLIRISDTDRRAVIKTYYGQ